MAELIQFKTPARRFKFMTVGQRCIAVCYFHAALADTTGTHSKKLFSQFRGNHDWALRVRPALVFAVFGCSVALTLGIQADADPLYIVTPITGLSVNEPQSLSYGAAPALNDLGE